MNTYDWKQDWSAGRVKDAPDNAPEVLITCMLNSLDAGDLDTASKFANIVQAMALAAYANATSLS